MLYTYNGLCYTFPIIEVPVDDIQHKIQQYIFLKFLLLPSAAGKIFFGS